ncbi:short-chain dehydrogenase TIC 32, chloroplastic-like [Canna indica]|uniref:Short-chain dehydrogenase TIC 32, chloroplastic-like n=1 Tax=Canna indica TaxID=4628 RepID=A0AAQ3KA34_9LILI|nr:short-chain dehydrogenase TIC 32, chloroplastic-like [Canna indica]
MANNNSIHLPEEERSSSPPPLREGSEAAMQLLGWLWRLGASSVFGSSSTAEQITEGVDASHLTAIVTGATNGIGKETARVLALRGATVIIPSRTLDGGLKVKQSLLEQNPKADLHVMEMDLCSLDSVNSFARDFNSSHKNLNILINNAGIMACPFRLSRDGIELQFATNHLGHFLLTNLLLDKMKATSKKMGVQGRIINVSSTAHLRSDGSCFSLDKLNDQSNYKAFGAYAHSKLANILHANELSRRLQEEGCNITVNSLHPGLIVTNIGRYLNINPTLMKSLAMLAKPFVKSIPQGAATTCYLALHPSVKDVTGKYFVNCKEEMPSPQARDEVLSKKLWEFSGELLKSSSKNMYQK